jgi:acyl-CoA synthetase (AMP-forming)/AMP-acid ligase II
LIELLQRAVGAHGASTAVITDDATFTFADLLRLSTAMASGLSQRDISRFAVIDPDAATAIVAFAASSAVGAEVCQYPADISPESAAELAERLDHTTVLTRRSDLPFAKTFTLDDLIVEGAELPPLPESRPLMVLTSGTTGGSRGVLHDWNRVISGMLGIRPSPGERWLLAYGLHQFGGLQVLMHAAAACATLVAPTPRRPREGLAAMRRYGVTHGSATPTFWRFVLTQMRADADPAPDLRQITLGGEAVPDKLLRDLRDTFPSAKISQIYGSTESGNPRSTRDGKPGLPISALDAGDDADIQLKIVDGELWVRSKIGMLGYYDDPALDSSGWRATGDQVEVVGDRILFRGRRSEVINVGGVKVHPFAVEERVLAVTGVEIARVFGRPNPLSGAIVAVEAVLAPGVDIELVKSQIREACADLPAAFRPRSIRIVDELKTAGNKIARGMSQED